MIEFKEFPKIARLNREVIVTEKIDGTNACVVITDDGIIGAQSRTKMLDDTKNGDNFGFCRWVYDNQEELRKLGPGYHFGEWWGQGIQRGYGLTEKRFSLFNVSRWADAVARPSCCHVVPVISRGDPLDSFNVAKIALDLLRNHGSYAATGFGKPEGIVAFHTAANMMFKATLDKDEEYKGKSKAA